VSIPLKGDRSAWDTVDYPNKHARDVELGTPSIHVPIPTTPNSSLVSDPSGQYWTEGLPAAGNAVQINISEALDAGDLINIYNDGGAKARKADASLNYTAVGYVLEVYSLEEIATVYLSGIITGLTGLTPGAKQYLSTTGDITETAPTTTGYIVHEVGTALSATTMIFEPQQTILLE
jgi:hypothetical protein